MQLVGVQLDSAWEDMPANHAAVQRLLVNSPPQPGSLIALPEMFATGFSLDVAKIEQSCHGRATERFVAELAQHARSTVIAGLVNRGPDGRGLNQALVVGPGGAELARYAKIHPFSFGEEHQHYAGGDRIALFEWHGLTVAPLICYDLRFPEVFRHAALRGAEVFVVIASWPAARESHWVALLTARAIENQAYVLGVNRCGRDPKHAYGGRSLIIDPRGNVVAEAGSEACVVSADVDAAALRAYRAEFPALRDVRRQFLGP